jgi:hypothetical protein
LKLGGGGHRWFKRRSTREKWPVVRDNEIMITAVVIVIVIIIIIIIIIVNYIASALQYSNKVLVLSVIRAPCFLLHFAFCSDSSCDAGSSSMRRVSAYTVTGWLTTSAVPHYIRIVPHTVCHSIINDQPNQSECSVPSIKRFSYGINHYRVPAGCNFLAVAIRTVGELPNRHNCDVARCRFCSTPHFNFEINYMYLN